MRPPVTTLLFLLSSCSRGSEATAPPETAGRPAESSPVVAPSTAVAPARACERPATRAALAPLEEPLGAGIVLAQLGPRKVALVADADTKLVHTVDLGERREIAQTQVAGEPSALLVAPDGRIAVALRDRGAVQLLDAGPTPEAPLVPLCETLVPAEPVALGFGGGALLVVSRWAAKLTALGLPDASGTWSQRGERQLDRDPMAIAVTKDRAIVLHAAGGVVDDLPLTAFAQAADPKSTGRKGVVRLTTAIPGLPRRVPEKAPPPPTFRDRVGTQGYGLAADPASGRVFAALALALEGPEPESWDRESAIVGEIAVVEPDGELRGSPFLSRGSAADCRMPRAAAYDHARRLVLVACAGIDVLEAFESGAHEPAIWGPHRKDARAAPRPAERRTPRQTPRWRAKVGSGPLAVAVDAKAGRAWVWGAFDGTLTEVTLGGESREPDAKRSAEPIRLRRASALPDAIERGRVLFHAGGSTRRVAADGRACASCHMDGRDDGLTWFFTKEGPRQTPMLLGRIEGTAPYGWEGDESLEGHFRRTLRRLGGIGLSNEERDAIFAYLASLQPPSASGGPRSKDLVARGAEVFASAGAGCGTCHTGGVGVDGMQHDVRSRAPLDRLSRFDTPSLRFVARSAPYFHDGRYATLEALLDGTRGTMGHTKQLSAADRAALLAFLESL